MKQIKEFLHKNYVLSKKFHYLYHYPYYLSKVSSLKVLNCKRFESLNAKIKQLFNLSKNRRNSCSTIMSKVSLNGKINSLFLKLNFVSLLE